MANKISFEIIAVDKVSGTFKIVQKELDGLKEKTNGSTSALKTQISSMGDLVGSLKKISPKVVAVAAGLGALAVGAKKCFDEFSESERVAAKLSSVLKSTGGVSGMTERSLNTLANSLSELSGVDDEVIKSGEALLLTFRNVGSKVFPDVMKTAIGMKTLFDGDLNSSILQLGKALQDPIEGVGALRRVGVALSDQQEAMIKKFMAHGDVASAQNVIMKELANEGFSDLAEATGATPQARIDAMNVKIGNLKESIGGLAAPYVVKGVKILSDIISGITGEGVSDDPVQQAIDKVANAKKRLKEAEENSSSGYSGGKRLQEQRKKEVEDSKKDIATAENELRQLNEKLAKERADASKKEKDFTEQTAKEKRQAQKEAHEKELTEKNKQSIEKRKLAIQLLKEEQDFASSYSNSLQEATSKKSLLERSDNKTIKGFEADIKAGKTFQWDTSGDNTDAGFEAETKRNELWIEAQRNVTQERVTAFDTAQAIAKSQEQLDEEQRQRDENFSEMQNRKRIATLDAVGAGLGALAALNKALKGNAKITQTLLIGETIMNTAAGIMAHAKDPFPLNVLQGAAIAISGAAQVATISSQKFATGAKMGPVKGPGQGDTVPIMANGGEGVFTVEQQARLFKMATGEDNKGNAINININASDNVDTKTIVSTLDNLARDGYFSSAYYLKGALAV